MTMHPWNQQSILICIDSYENGVPQGLIYLPGQQAQGFDSLSQLLLRTEQLLDLTGLLQSFTIPRSFAAAGPLPEAPREANDLTRGRLATFQMRVLFRQHASWQGELQWLESGEHQSFRSVLELVSLMDSALRAEKL